MHYVPEGYTRLPTPRGVQEKTYSRHDFKEYVWVVLSSMTAKSRFERWVRSSPQVLDARVECHTELNLYAAHARHGGIAFLLGPLPQ